MSLNLKEVYLAKRTNQKVIKYSERMAKTELRVKKS